MVTYNYQIPREVDAIVVRGYRLPMMVIRTDGANWKVISTTYTQDAVEPAVLAVDPVLHLDPLAKTRKFRGAKHILFVGVRDEDQVLRFLFPTGRCSTMVIQANGFTWRPSTSWIIGRAPTPEQMVSERDYILLSTLERDYVMPSALTRA